MSDGSLQGQTVVLIGGSSGIGLETARLARAAGADVILAGRDPARLERAAADVGAVASTAFDATDAEALQQFMDGLPLPVDHVLVTAGTAYYALLPDFDENEARHDIESHVWLPIRLGRLATGRVRPGGSLLFMGGTGGRRPGPGLVLMSTLTNGLPALVGTLALELAPIRVNLIAAGFVDTPLSAAILGDGLEARRAELRGTLPIGRVVEAQDVAALAIQLMANTALTGATYDVDGGQGLVPRA